MNHKVDGVVLAPLGQIWKCLACGKVSRSQYGFDSERRNVASPGWGASCVLNSVLIEDLDDEGVT